MFKRLSLAIMIVLSIFTLTACTEPEEQLSDGDYLRQLRDEIAFTTTELTSDVTIPSIEGEGVTVSWTSSDETYLTNTGTVTQPDYTVGDKTIYLTLVLEKNDAVVNKVFEFTVISLDRPEIIELNTDKTDDLQLTFTYEGLDFIDDGVGEVELSRCIDGDTAIFTQNGNSYSVRFLGVNTPESTARFEPWGKAASEFTCDKLENAETIVLQSDPAEGRLDSYGTRYLGWVWYDGRLLNLELVEQALGQAQGSVSNLYGETMFRASLDVQDSDRRIWGETDPDFDYSLEGIQLTIEELVTNHAEYEGLKVVITGIVSRKLGGAAFIQQGDYGVYLYNRTWAPDLSLGNEVLLSGLTVTYYNGALQATGYQSRTGYSEVLSRDNVVTPKTILVSDITYDNLGSLLRVEDLEITDVYEGDDSFTITAEDASGNEITIRKDASVTEDISVSLFEVGQTVTIIAPLSQYMGTYQLMISSAEDIITE